MATQSLVVIVGETGSGKSALAFELAKRFNGELISADSWTVYKGFDIGTAKPTKAEQQAVPHHLLDIADPLKGFSAAEFKRQAETAIEDVSSRGKLPILVGGTGLYIDSIVYDYGFLPAGSATQRDKLNQLSIGELLTKIKQADISLEGIDIRNKRRLIRLLEVGGERPARQAFRANTLMIGLQLPTEKLRKQVIQRVEYMLAKGLENEVRQLADKYGWDVEPMKGIGYREFKDYLAGRHTLEEAKQKIINDSMQLAKKQRTWFKRNKYIHWLNDPSESVELLTTFLNKKP